MPALSLHGIELASEWRRVMLRGRGQQCETLDGLLADVRATRPRRPRTFSWPGLWVSSRRWSCRSRRCTSSAVRC